MKTVLSILMLAAAVGHAATSITSSYGTVSGSDDNNQAGPIRGVTYRIITTGTYTNPGTTAPNIHTLSATDATATQVQFQSLSWQRSSSTAMAGTWYVSIFSGLTVDTNGNVTGLGTFMGASTNTVASPASLATMTWNFNNVLLTVGSDYQFVFTTTATPTLTSDIGAGQFELNVATNGLAETQLVAGNSTAYSSRANWEPVFSMTYNAVPESGAALLGSLGIMTLLRRRR